MPREAVTERKVIDELARIFKSPPAPEGMGDDCAVLRMGNERLLVSTDMLSASTHFHPLMSAYQKGRMAAAVNFSDVAAMGGRPFALLISLGIPDRMKMGEIRAVARGIYDCSKAYRVRIIGGDTKRTEELTISGTAIGRKKGKLLLRSSASAGQMLAMTGRLGDAAADYLGLSEGRKPGRDSRLFNPVPRVEEGSTLGTSGTVSAAIDMTDGLALSAWYLSRASGVRIEIDAEKLPVSPRLLRRTMDGRSRDDAIYHWGGDYELLFTFSSLRVLKRVAPLLRTPVTVIGKVVRGNGVYVRSGSSLRRLDERGYDAFGGNDIAAPVGSN